MSDDQHGWTHAMCEACWLDREPDRVPHRLRTPDLENCCFCGTMTVSGIYARQDPKSIHIQHCVDREVRHARPETD